MPYKTSEEFRKKRRTQWHAWSLKNREHRNAQSRAWYGRNRESQLLRSKMRHISHPLAEKYHALKSNSKKRGYPFLLTRAEFDRWFLSQKQQCAYCDLVDLSLDIKLVHGHTSLLLTIDRKNSDLPYTQENMALACWLCNRGKGNVFTHDEWRQIAQTYVKPKWMKKMELLNVA